MADMINPISQPPKESMLKQGQSLLSRFFKKKLDDTPNLINFKKEMINNPSSLISYTFLSNFYYSYISSDEQDLTGKLSDFQAMYKDPIMNNALELLVDESTNYSPTMKKKIWPVCKDESIQEITNKLFNDLNAQEIIGTITSRVVLYGNCPVRIYYKDEGGIAYVEVEENMLRYIPIEINGTLIKWYDKYTQDILEPYEVKFFKTNNITDFQVLDTYYTVTQNKEQKEVTKNTWRYGASLFENVRRLWRQLKLLEDNMILVRLERSLSTRLYKLNVGKTKPQDASDLIDFYAQLLTTERTMSIADDVLSDNPGQMGFGTNIILPVNETQGIEVDHWGGDADVGSILDIDYFKQKFYAALKIPAPFLGMCVRGNVKIKLASGENTTIKELFDNKEKYINKVGIFACDKDGKISIQLIKNISMNRPNTNFVRVWLDNAEYVDMTPDHPFMMRDGTFIEAQNLKPGDSLMPLYTKVDSGGYEELRDNNTNKWKKIHRMMGEALIGRKIKTNEVVHHKDRNKINNNFDNIEVLSTHEHYTEHKIIANKWVKKWLEAKPAVPVNHKVVRVDKLDIIEDAYDITVGSKEHCFALSAGIFVHNTEDLPGSLGESSLVRLEIRFARLIRKIQFILMKGFKDIIYYHLLSLNKQVDFEDFDAVMNIVSTAEDEEFKNSLSNSVDMLTNLVSLIGNLKDLIQSGDFDKESTDDLLDYISMRILNSNDFNWRELFDSIKPEVDAPEGEELEGEEESEEAASKQNKKPTSGTLAGEIAKVSEFTPKPGSSNNPKPGSSSNPKPATSNNPKSLVQSLARVSPDKRKKILEYVNRLAVLSSAVNVPKFEYNKDLQYIKESKEDKTKKYLAEATDKKYKITEVRKIMDKYESFDVGIFKAKYENIKLNIVGCDTKVVKEPIDLNDLIFMHPVYQIQDILNTGRTEQIMVYKFENKLYINYNNTLNLFKCLVEDKELKDRFKIIELSEKKGTNKK